VPVSSVPPSPPATSTRASSPAHSESVLPFTPATDDAPAGAASAGEQQNGLRSSRRKGGQAADGTATTSKSDATAKSSAAQTPAARADSVGAAGTGSASFGQTLNATLSATSAAAAAATLASGSTPARAGGARGSAGSASASKSSAPGATSADPGKISDTISAARAAAPEASPAEESGAEDDTSPELTRAALASSAAGGSSRETAGPTAAGAAAGASTPSTAPPPVPTFSSPMAGADSATADGSAGSVGTVDLATRAAPTSAQLFAELSRSLGDSGGSTTALPAKSADDTADTTQAQAAAAPASVDSTAQASESPAPPAAATTATLHSQVGTAAWSNELGSRLTVMAQQGITSASLRLSPPQLGPLEVRIAVRDNSASVWFGASQSDTRAALEQALPRLREMFASHGLNLTNAGVSGETPRGTPRNGQSASLASTTADATGEVAGVSVASSALVHQGLIDTYA
jgi:flagellar hook-length control protein FliK